MHATPIECNSFYPHQLMWQELDQNFPKELWLLLKLLHTFVLNPPIAPPRSNYCGMTNIILGMEVPKSAVTNKNSRDEKLQIDFPIYILSVHTSYWNDVEMSLLHRAIPNNFPSRGQILNTAREILRYAHKSLTMPHLIASRTCFRLGQQIATELISCCMLKFVCWLLWQLTAEHSKITG